MTYWFYENWFGRVRKAKIYLANCYHCNNGKGTEKATDSLSIWHGPFQTFREAEKLAIQTGAVVSNCKTCNPQDPY